MTSNLSAATRDRLAKERLELLQRRHELEASLAADVDSVGDRADEADRLSRGDHLVAVNRRIEEISEALSHPDFSTADRLSDGTRLTVVFADGAEETLTVVAAVAADARAETPDAVITPDSPLGVALVGAKAGDTVTYRAPSGESTVTVLAVEPPDA